MQVAPPGGQFCNQCKCDPSNDQFCKTMQVALSGGWFCNQRKWRHLVNKFSTDADALAVLAVPAVWASSPSSPALLTVPAVQAVQLLALLLCTYRIYRALWACFTCKAAIFGSWVGVERAFERRRQRKTKSFILPVLCKIPRPDEMFQKYWRNLIWGQ